MSDCRAREELRAWLIEMGHSQAWLARQLLVSAPAVHAWLEGISRPGTHLRELIEQLTSGKVPKAHWETDKERLHRANAQARFVAEEAS